MGNPFLDTIGRLRDERDRLQDAIKKYVDERKELKAEIEDLIREKNKQFEESIAIIHDEGARRIMAEEENDRLKIELAAATFNDLPF